MTGGRDMTHASRADLEARFGAGEIERLAGEGRVDAALADASAAVDAALGAAYDLPLPGANFPVLTGIACDLARERLYDYNASDTVAGRAKAARDTLDIILSGNAALVDGAGRALPRRAVPARTSGPAPAMTEDNLAGL